MYKPYDYNNNMYNNENDTPLLIKLTENPRLGNLRILASFDQYLKSFSTITAQYQGTDMCCTSSTEWNKLHTVVTQHISQCLDEMRTNHYRLLVSKDIAKRIAKSAKAAGLEYSDAMEMLTTVTRPVREAA